MQGGHDTFAFAPNNGNDFVYDFCQGEDYIELAGFYKGPIPDNAAAAYLPAQALISFSDLNIQMVDTDGNGVVDSSVIDFYANTNDSVTVYGVTNLTASDFLILA
jgi:hypothetical protein